MINAVGASLLAMAVCQSMVHELSDRYREQARSHRGYHRAYPFWIEASQASGILRKPTAKRFQPLMALIATVRSTISLGLKCSLSKA